MIERTKAKLAEARIQLDRLKAERFRQVQNASPTVSPEFLFQLDTFIQTARSVRWVLQSEEETKYKAWEPSRKAAMNDNEARIFKLVNCMRVAIVKRGDRGIEARREQVEIPENPHPAAGSQYQGLQDWDRPTTMIDVCYFEGVEVVSLCEQYLDILTREIDDFERTSS
jgi:hypothetical protein